MSPKYVRRHVVDVFRDDDGPVWIATCLSCDWQRAGFYSVTDAEDKADEHALTAPWPDGDAA